MSGHFTNYTQQHVIKAAMWDVFLDEDYIGSFIIDDFGNLVKFPIVQMACSVSNAEH